MDIQQEQVRWIEMTEKNLDRIMQEFFLQNMSSGVRQNSLKLLKALWKRGSLEQKSLYIDNLEGMMTQLPCNGKNSKEYFQLLAYLIREVMQQQENVTQETQSLRERIVQIMRSLVQILRTTFQQMEKNPNHPLYLFLENQFDVENQFKPAYFQLNGCLRCFSNDSNCFQCKRITHVSESQSNLNRTIFKFHNFLEISQLQLTQSNSMNTLKNQIQKVIQSIVIYNNNSLSQDFTALQNDMGLWRKLKTVIVEPNQPNDIIIQFNIPVSVKHLCIEINLEKQAQGIIANSRNSESFTYFNIDQTEIWQRPSVMSDELIINTEKSRENAQASIVTINETVSQKWELLLQQKHKMNVLYEQYKGIKCDNLQKLDPQYTEIQSTYNDLMLNLKGLIAHQKALNEYLGTDDLTDSFLKSHHESATNCYGCQQQFTYFLLNFLSMKQIQAFLTIFCNEDVDTLCKYLIILIRNSETLTARLQTKVFETYCLLRISSLNQERFESLVSEIDYTGNLIERICNSQEIEREGLLREFSLTSTMWINLNNYCRVYQAKKTVQKRQEKQSQNVPVTVPVQSTTNTTSGILLNSNTSNLSQITQSKPKDIASQQIDIPVNLEFLNKFLDKFLCLLQKSMSFVLKASNENPDLVNQLAVPLIVIYKNFISEPKKFEIFSSNSSVGNLGEDVLKREYLQKSQQIVLATLFNCSASWQMDEEETSTQQPGAPKNSGTEDSLRDIEQKTLGLKLDKDLWISQIYTVYNSRRFSEVAAQIMATIASLDKYWACQILVNSIDVALKNDIRANEYFQLLKKTLDSKEIAYQVKPEQKKIEKQPPKDAPEQMEIQKEQEEVKKPQEEKQMEIEVPKNVPVPNPIAEQYMPFLESLFVILDKQLAEFAQQQEARIIKEKEFCILTLTQGYSLKELSVVIRKLVEDQQIREEFKKKSSLFLKYIVSSVVNLRNYASVLNQHLQAIESNLNFLFEQLQSENIDEKQVFLKDNISLLPNLRNNPIGQGFLLEQINKIMLPRKLVFKISCEAPKSHAELEHFRCKLPEFSSADLGPKISDLLKAIKGEFILAGDLNIEMVINQRLVNVLDLPLQLVYRKFVLKPYLDQSPDALQDNKDIHQIPLPPMKVQYRICGLDGLATEKLLDNVEDDEEKCMLSLSEGLFEDVTYLKDGRQQKTTTGIEVLLKILSQFYEDPQNKMKIYNILKIFSTVFNHKEAVYLALDSNGLNILIKILSKYLPPFKEGENDAFIEKTLENILKLLENSDLKQTEHFVRKASQNFLDGEEFQGDINQLCKANIKICLEQVERLEEQFRKNCQENFDI